jgi:hypothetical protein
LNADEPDFGWPDELRAPQLTLISLGGSRGGRISD